jgi:protein subunit release factor A
MSLLNATKLNKEYKELGKIVAEYRKYQDVLSNCENALVGFLKDEDFRQMAKDELDELTSRNAWKIASKRPAALKTERLERRY